jgi:hypothetical protein
MSRFKFVENIVPKAKGENLISLRRQVTRQILGLDYLSRLNTLHSSNDDSQGVCALKCSSSKASIGDFEFSDFIVVPVIDRPPWFEQHWQVEDFTISVEVKYAFNYECKGDCEKGCPSITRSTKGSKVMSWKFSQLYITPGAYNSTLHFLSMCLSKFPDGFTDTDAQKCMEEYIDAVCTPFHQPVCSPNRCVWEEGYLFVPYNFGEYVEKWAKALCNALVITGVVTDPQCFCPPEIPERVGRPTTPKTFMVCYESPPKDCPESDGHFRERKCFEEDIAGKPTGTPTGTIPAGWRRVRGQGAFPKCNKENCKDDKCEEPGTPTTPG